MPPLRRANDDIVRPPERLSRNWAHDATKGATRSMPTKLPTSQTRKVRHASGLPARSPHRPTITAPVRASTAAPAAMAPTSRGDTKRSGGGESCAATAPPANVTTTSMSAYPSESSSDDPTSGSKISAPRNAPASTGIQSDRVRTNSSPNAKPLASQTPHASCFEYAKKAENAPSARYATATTRMVCTLPKDVSFRRRDKDTCAYCCVSSCEPGVAAMVTPCELYAKASTVSSPDPAQDSWLPCYGFKSGHEASILRASHCQFRPRPPIPTGTPFPVGGKSAA